MDVMTSFPRKGNEAQAVTSSGADAAPIPKGKNPSRTGPTSTHPAVPPSCGGPPSAKALPTGDPGSSAQRARLTLLPAPLNKQELRRKKNSAEGCRCQSDPELRVPDHSAPTAVQENASTMG